MALGDKDVATRCLAELFGATSDHAVAGCRLLADMMQTVRMAGSIHIKWSNRDD